MDENADRRVQRTRKLLRSTLVELIKEKGYDALTVQAITDRANVGRTTFYLHYDSKEALLLDHHAEMHDLFNLTVMPRSVLLGEQPHRRWSNF